MKNARLGLPALGPMLFAFGLALLTIAPQSPLSAQQPGERSYHDESVMPEGILGERIQSLIETLNSADPDRIARFIEDETTSSFQDFAPMEEHQSVWMSVNRRWGDVTFHSIRKYDPARDITVVILKDANFGNWRAFSFSLDPNEENRLDGLNYNDARPPSNVTEEALTAAGLLPEIGQLVERSCELDLFSGTVLVARGEQVVYSHACGEASKRFHVPVNLQTKFNLGSMNKMFTSIAIMQLVERGVLSLDDPISEYVDETWLPREVTDKVTIHHLLTHTSGLGSYFNQTYMESSREMFRALDDYKPLIEDDRPAFEPGTDWQYSNTGMFLLGVVIESAAGEDYFDFIRENIYEPAGMVNSDSYEMDQPVENLAIGYDRHPGVAQDYENNLYKHVIKGGPAGGGFSTVEDLHRFALALLNGAYLSEESLELLWTDHAEASYGYGFGIQELDGIGKVVGHGGGFSGISSNLDILLDRDLIIAVMSNYGGAASPIAGGINRLIGRVPTETG